MPDVYKDRIVQYPKRVTIKADGTEGTSNDPALDGKEIALTVNPGVVTEAGTPLDAEELNARDSNHNVVNVTYQSAGEFRVNILGYNAQDDNKLTLRFAGTVPEADLDLPAKVSVDNGVTLYTLKLKDTGNVISCRFMVNPEQIADVFFDGTDLIINRVEAILSPEVAYRTTIQTETVYNPLENSPFFSGQNGKLIGESAENKSFNGNFDSGATGWTLVTATGGVSGGVYSWTATAQNAQLTNPTTFYPLFIGDRYYLMVAKFKTDSNLVRINIAGVGSRFHSGSGEYEIIGSLVQWPSASSGRFGARMQDTRAGSWTQIDVEFIMVIDVTVDVSNGLTEAELTEKYSIYFDDLKSVQNPELKIRNKNLTPLDLYLDNVRPEVNTFIENGKLIIDFTTTYFFSESGLIPIADYGMRPGDVVSFSVIREIISNPSVSGINETILWFDETGSLLLESSTAADPSATERSFSNVTIPEGTLNFKFRLARSGTAQLKKVAYEEIQLEKAIVSTSNIKSRISNRKYEGTYRGLPNGVADEIDTINNKLNKNVETFVVENSDIAFFSGTNVNLVRVNKTAFVNWANPTLEGWFSYLTDDYVGFNGVGWDATSNIGKTTTTISGTYNDFVVDKTAVPDLTAAQALFNGKIIQYQLDETVVSDIDSDGEPEAYDNMTIELIQDNGFGFGVKTNLALNESGTLKGLANAVKSLNKQLTALEDKVDLKANQADLVGAIIEEAITSFSPFMVPNVTVEPAPNITLAAGKAFSQYNKFKLAVYDIANGLIRYSDEFDIDFVTDIPLELKAGLTTSSPSKYWYRFKGKTDTTAVIYFPRFIVDNPFANVGTTALYIAQVIGIRKIS